VNGALEFPNTWKESITLVFNSETTKEEMIGCQ